MDRSYTAPVQIVALDDGWRARERTDDLATTYWRRDLDDADWAATKVPGQWASLPGPAPVRGPMAYRVAFSLPRVDASQRARVRVGGVFYYGHYWLDDTYLGDRHGYFLAHEVDATEALRARDDHLLAVEVECPDQADRTAKTIVTGVFSHWDAIDPEFNPGGIWRPVEVVVTGPAYLGFATVQCREVSPAAARLAVRLGVDSDEERHARVDLTLREADTGNVVDAVGHAVSLAQGTTVVELALAVSRPRLWWPHTLGDQPLYDLEVSLTGPEGDEWDRAERTTGLRDLTVDDWIFKVNGERIFVRGANHAPTRMALAEITPADSLADVRLAKEANLDLLRVHAHVSPDHLYEAADREGLLLWQDFPLQWGYARRIKREAVAQARGLARALGHHPSIALWCCHNEPLSVEITDVAEMSGWQAARAALSLVAPSWNKNRLDPALRRAFEDEDPSRFCNEKSGEMPSPWSGGTDTHMYCGWYVGKTRDFGRLVDALPRLTRFVSEFGAQALPRPELVESMGCGHWPDLDWDHLRERHSAQPALLHRYVPPDGHADLAAYVSATQRYQGELLKYHIEALRRRKYAPAGGFAMFAFADSYPAVTWSVLDADRVPKLGYGYVRDACADVIVCADWPEAQYEPGATVNVGLYVVSDLRRPLHGLALHARLGSSAHVFEGGVDSDSVAFAGEFVASAPTTAGSHRLELSLLDSHGTVLAVNSYGITVG